MSKASLELGGTNWGTKDGNLLAYAQGNESNKFVPREFTFTRGSDIAATRINSSGVIEKYRENLLLQSNQFDTSPWVSSSVTLTSGQSGYDGSTDAWLLTKNGTGFKNVYQYINELGVATLTVHAKAGSTNWMRLTHGGKTAYFDLSGSGAIGVTSNGIDQTITSVGNGWFKCTLTANRTVAGQVPIYPYTAEGDQSGSTDSIYIQDVQLEKGLVATSYLESGATKATSGVADNEPRIDYAGGTASLLLEPSRTNLLTYSEYYNGWTQSGTTLTTNTTETLSPEGLYNASKLVGNGTTGVINSGIAKTGSVAVSVYLKSVSGSVNVTFKDPYGGLANEVKSVTTEWQRFDFIGDNGFSFAGFWIDDIPASGIYMWGAQLEEGSYPTSYIPTYGTSVTRNADGFQKTGASSVIGQTEGTLYIEAIFKEEGNLSQWFSLTDGTANNWVFIGKDNDDIRGYIRANNIVAFTNQTFQITNNTVVKAALSYKSGSISLYINGSLIASSTNSFSFNQPLDTIRSATYNTQTTREKVNFNKILVFKNALTNAECITLTT